MSKLFKLKKWLTLEDTCKRLSTTLEEDVNVKDLIQLIIEGDLRVSWYFQMFGGYEAVKVIKDNVYVLGELSGEEFLSTNVPLKHITYAKENITEGELFRVFIDNKTHWNDRGIYRDYRVSSSVIDLEGIYNIHIDTGDMKTYFENILFDTKAPYESEFFTGVILEDEEGGLYKIVNPYLDEDSKPEDRISNWAQPPYPSPDKPKLSDLVILRSDLETFEQSFLVPDKQKQLRGSTDNLTLSLGLMSVILSKTQSKYSNGSKPNFSQLSVAIEQEAAKLGLDLKEISNLQRALSTSHKMIKKLIE
jgi:hypothetical protein